MILIENKYLLVKSDTTPPEGKTLVYNDVLYRIVPWGLKAYMQYKGVAKLPNPMNAYDFLQSPYVPMSHQRVTSENLTIHLKCFCWNEAGTGKTASCIWSYDYLRSQEVVKKLLVICPLSTVHDVWGNELFKMLMHLKHAILIGSKQKRLELLAKNYDIYVINHDGIKVLKDELIKWKPDLIIADEHTAFKNQRTERYKALRAIFKTAKGIWMLSGTPAPQAPTDLFAPARMVCPDQVGRSFMRFRSLTMYQVGMYKWLPKPNFEEIVKGIIKPVIRFSRNECLDLPDVVTQTFNVEMSPKQKLAYEKLRKDAILQIDGGEITVANEGVMRNKLLQCCCGYIYDSEKNVIDLLPKRRQETIKELIEEAPHNVIVFMNYRSSIEALYKYLKKDFAVCVIHGDVSVKRRTEHFRDFQNGKLNVIIAHPKTAAHGVNLTAASTVIWGLVTSDNELYQQANSRIQRIGQTNKMRVIHLVSTPLERKILVRLEEKRSMQGVLLEVLGKK